ncbi:MAG TPA: hypothetical protein VNJ02_11465 [Vicinamibacterales bacterium]|nr:hypothetical protein [Vicinamibacterales bacterium]
MIFLSWLMFGAIVGLAAAQKKGFSTVTAVVGGMFLGPLSPLMFFVSGVSRDENNKKCPHCAEWVKAAAIVCKHCHQRLESSAPPPTTRPESRGIVLDEGFEPPANRRQSRE